MLSGEVLLERFPRQNVLASCAWPALVHDCRTMRAARRGARIEPNVEVKLTLSHTSIAETHTDTCRVASMDAIAQLILIQTFFAPPPLLAAVRQTCLFVSGYKARRDCISYKTCMNLECTAKRQLKLVDGSTKILLRPVFDIVVGLLIFAPRMATVSLVLCQTQIRPLLDAPQRQR